MTGLKLRPLALIGLALVVVLGASGCRTRSALDTALEDRMRWKVMALDWTQTDEQVVLLSTRLSGPASSSLDRLTVKILLLDAAGDTVQEAWHTFDLTGMPRGGPEDFTVRIPATQLIEGLGVDSVPSPSAEEYAQIPELLGLE